MTKPKQGGPQYEVPTEWRRIVMEEDKDGHLRPVAVEEAPIGEGVHLVREEAQASEAPADMPQEWHDILQSSNGGGAAGISLVGDGQDAGEHTIPGMRIPQLYDEEMVSLDTNTGYSIGGEMSVPERTTVGSPPPPPPEYEEFPFSEAPDSNAQLEPPRKSPLIVPAPQGEAFVPPPHSVLAAEQSAALGMYATGNHAVGAPLSAAEQLPLSTVEIDVPMGTSEHEPTNELDAGFAQSEEQDLEQILSAEDFAGVDDMGEFDDDDQEDTGAFGNIQLPPDDPGQDAIPIASFPAQVTPAAPAAAFDSQALQALLAPMFDQMFALQRETMSQFERMQQDLGLQHEAQEEAQQKLDEIAAVCNQQQEAQTTQERTLQRVSSALDVDREEQTFLVMHDVLQDLLLLYDFVDLRMRSLWDQYGKEHPSTNEMASVRERLLELLERQDIVPVEINDSSFDPDTQRALQEILTADPQEDGHISRIFRQGFRYKDKVFRPSEVEVKRYPTS